MCSLLIGLRRPAPARVLLHALEQTYHARDRFVPDQPRPDEHSRPPTRFGQRLPNSARTPSLPPSLPHSLPPPSRPASHPSPPPNHARTPRASQRASASPPPPTPSPPPPAACRTTRPPATPPTRGTSAPPRRAAPRAWPSQ